MITHANYQKHNPAAVNALLALDKTVADSTLGQTIIDLIRIRVSQINGCLFCLDMHTKEARTRGERELRLHHLTLWRESSLFSDREKAALDWAELLTRPGTHGVGEEAYAAAAERFNEKEIVDLTFVVSSINAWNRLGIAFRPAPGSLDKLMGLDKIGLE